jgi:hypothetical protein
VVNRHTPTFTQEDVDFIDDVNTGEPLDRTGGRRGGGGGGRHRSGSGGGSGESGGGGGGGGGGGDGRVSLTYAEFSALQANTLKEIRDTATESQKGLPACSVREDHGCSHPRTISCCRRVPYGLSSRNRGLKC